MENREPRKRVVLREPDGLYRIIGLFDPSVHELRDTVQYQHLWQHTTITAKLAAVTDKYVLYRQEA